MDHDSALFVSLVGQQPLAVAGPLASWLSERPQRLARVLLLATPSTKPFADRLASWAVRVHTLTCDVLLVAESLQREDVLQPVDAVLAKWQEDHRQQNMTLVFNADAGKNAHVVTVIRHLGTDTVHLHSRSDWVYALSFPNGQEHWDRFRPANLGLQNTLNLQDIPFRVEAFPLPDPLHNLLKKMGFLRPQDHGLAVNLTVFHPDKQGDEHAFTFDLAYEQAGRVYALCTIFQTTKSTEPIRNRHHRIIKARSWNPAFRPEICVLSNNDTLLERIARSNMLAISSTTESGAYKLEQWLRQSPPPPRSQERFFGAKGTGGKGPPLVVFLGADPSPTLVSLYSHQPSLT